MKDDIRNLYDALVKNGYQIDDLGGSEENFRANMRDEKIRGEFYDWVVGRDDFNIGSREAYERRMTGALNPTAEQGIIPEPNPAPEIDKSQYTFTGEQLGIDDIVQEQRAKAALRTYNELPTEDHSYELHGNTPYRELLEVGKKMNALDAADPENKAALDALKFQEARLLREIMPLREEDIERRRREAEEENRKSFGEKLLDGVGELGAKAVGAITAPVYAVGEFVGDAVDNVTGWDGMHKTMRAGRKKAEEALFGGTEGALALRNDILYKNGKDGELSLLGTVLQSTEEMAGGATTPVYDLLEKVGDVTGLEGVESVGKEGRRQYKENILADSWKKEDSFFGQAAQLVPQVAAIWGGIATGNPALMKAGTGIQVASSMGQAAHEAAEAGASGAQIFGASALNGIIELLTERIPLGRWLKKIPVNIGSEVVSKASTEVLEGEAEALFKEAKKRLGNKLTAKSAKEFAIDMASEGGSEFAAEFLQTLVPIIYKDAEEYPTFHEALQNGIDGLLGGIMMSGMIQPVASYTQRKADHIRRKEQGFVDVAQIKNAKDQYEVVEIVGENESGEFIGKRDNELVEVHPSVIVARRQFDYDAFRKNEMMEYSDEGYSQEPTGGNALAVTNEYTNARGEVVRALGLADDDDVDAFIGDRKPEEIAQGDEDTEMAITHYLQARARRDGFRERYQEERDRQFEESDKSIDGRSNNGSVYTTMLGDQQVHITGGDVVLNEDGTIDVNNSSESLFVEFPDGSKKPVTPDKFTDKVVMENADELKVAGRAAIEEKWKAEFDNAENAYIEQQKRAEGSLFDMTDENGTHRVEVIKEGKDFSNILLDGVPQKMSTEELNSWKQEAGIQSTENGVQSTDVVADDTTDNGIPTESEAKVAPTGDNVAPIELPNVPDFFRLGGTNYEVASRNADGSVDVIVDGKRETLPAGTDYSTHMPTDKKGEVQYEQMPVERTHEYFVQKVKDDEARAEMIEKRRKKAEAERKKFDKKPDPGIDPDAYEAKMTQWEADKKAAQAKVDYWNEVAKRETEITRSETREAVNNIKPRDVVEMTPDEFIAEHLPRITPESFKSETGLSNSEQAGLVGYIAGKDKGGMTVEEAAENILENYDSELRGLGFTGDMQDVRNAIIDILSSGNPRSYAKRGLEQRNQESIDQQRAEMETVAAQSGFSSVEEMAEYESVVVPRIIETYKGFDENEYYNNLAENYGNDTTRESESTGRGSELLQGEQAADNNGAPTAGVGNQGGAVSNNVQGGGQDGTPQGNQQVSEPVGNSEQLSSSEIPNNQSVAEGNAPGNGSVLLSDEVGPFGRIYRQFKGKAKEAIQFLLDKKEGEAVGALSHPEIGDIDLVWGEEGTSNSDGYGLAKLAKYHPEVLENLQEIINDMRVTKRSVNRVQLESDTHQAAVRLTWDNKSKNWLLTAFEKKNSVSDNTTDTGETSNGGKQNDTTTLQNTVSTSKSTTQSVNSQENAQKSGEIAESTPEIQEPRSVEDKDVSVATEDELDIYLAELKAQQERQKTIFPKLPRPSSFVEAYASNDTEAINKLDKQLDDALQMLVPMDITMVEATIKGMKDRKSVIKAGSANGRKETPAYKAFDHIEKVLAKRKKQLEKELTEDDKRRLDIIKRGNRGELKETTQPKQENKPVESEPIKDETPVTSEATEQPETGEVADAGPVNRETLRLNMSEEDFNALLNSGDKAAVSEYLAEMDGLLRIGVGSPLDGRDAIVKEYRGLVEQYGGEGNIPADVVAGINERIAPYNALQRAVFDRKYALQDKLREIETNEAQAKEQAEKEAKAKHKQTTFGGFLAGKTDLGASAAEKALSKKYNFDGKVMTVAEFVEDAVGNGNVKLSAIEEPKYKGASRAAWNRMDARQQEADAKRVKESGTKTVYTVNDHDLGKTAYDYAKFLLDKKVEQEKTVDGQTVLYRTSEDAEDIPRLDKHRVGSGPLTNREVVMESDVYSKVLGKPRYYGQKQGNYVARQRAKMAQKATELAEKLNTPIEVRETAEGLTGKKAKAKGWYDVKSGNIVVVVSNHGSIEDIQATVLHEVVAHKGLRQMFGEHFDTFLDNVYNNVDAEIRAEIDALTEKYGNTREATEEYLASLAENTYFEKVNPSLWSRIKQWFLNMLTEAGIKLDFELSDNELRYILWRSHQRLVNPGIYNPVTRITDVAVRARLGIGEYAPAVEEMSHAAEEDAEEYANKNQDIFVSNAQRAVEGIQQNKATAEQWIAMLKKNGGLKAGEDAWLGLEEWLAEKQGAVTKQEILDFIGANKIQIEEVEYEDLGKSIDYELAAVEGNLERARRDLAYEEAQVPIAEKWLQDSQEEYDSFLSTANRLKTEYGENSPEYRNYIFYDSYTDVLANAKRALENAKSDVEYRRQQIAELEKAVKEKQNQKTRGINRTRLDYTTEGLENKREIALVVPTVESWNASDEIHFGDAGNGRAVAWVRFGETTDSEGNRVLVIDEIQSKRHQDAREKGYKNASRQELESAVDAWDEAQNRYDAYNAEMAAKYGTTIEDWPAVATDAEIERYEELYNEVIKAGDAQEQIAENFHSGVPAAPFEKNWHELAMKRMLRLAAEEGFDKVAWTTGEQQAQRYDIGAVVNRIESNDTVDYDSKLGVDLVKQVVLFTRDGNAITLRLTPEGIVRASSQYNGHHISDIVGKELGNRIMTETDLVLKEQDLRIGGEGMKGFYDKMLPSFVQKYTKKWGAKVGEVTMPSLGENNTMWSVDVTPEMQESVMQGQTMFRMGSRVDARMAEVAAHFEGKQLTAEQQAVVDVFGGKADNLTISVKTKDGNERRVVMRQGNEMGAGAKHSLFRHFGMNNNEITADDILLIPEILANGEHVEKKRGKKTVIEYKYTDNNGVEYTVLTEIDSRREAFANFYTNRKASSAARKTRSEEARDIADDASEDKGSDNSSNSQEGETRFRTVEETTDGSIDDVPAQPLTLMERITNSLLEVSAKNKENLGLRADALRAFGRDINRVLSLMKAQRVYDKSTVDTLVKLAKMYFKNAQLLGEVTPYEVARIMGVLNRSVGKRDISTEAARLMDILLDAHTNALAGILDKAEKVKAKKVNAAGVEVMGRLDKYGQKRVDEYRAAKEMTPEKLEEAIYDSDNRLAELEQRVREELGLPEGDVDQAARDYTGDNDVVNVYMDERARLEGLTLAREYKESIQQVQEEIKDLKRELKQAEEDYRLGNIDGKSLKEFRKSVAEAIMESKAGLIEGYHSLIYKFQENTKESSKRAKAFAQAQIDRAREIQHNANSDMEGISAATQGTHPENYNNAVMNALRSPFPTLQGMLKKFGEKNVEGKGYLYERFIPQATKAGDNEFRGKVAARVMIEGKLKEIYGKEMTIAKFMKSLREDGVTIEYREGNEMKQFDLTKGQMLYIYMVNKMSDGQMKLRKMGITDDVVAELMTKLPEGAVQFADWAQNELLKDLRGKYNAVHERVFGAPMAAIENYFPIKIRKEARGEKGDVSEVGQEGKPSTVTGSIIKRTKNATAIDLSADAMQVLMEHIDDLEHWAAFAEFNRDINTLINYKDFQNQVKNMTSVRYGSGTELWKNFRKTAQIASGTYRPSDSSIDRAVQNIAKGLTRSKINFRLFTAVKQLLSEPAFWTEAGVEELAYCYANPKGSFDWALENLPGFAERWQGRTMGNEKLLKSDSDWELWRNEFVEKATRWGMTPNAAIDALTVAQGARAVYMTKLEQFKKAGYTEQRANEKALQAAAEAYNESQQSSEGIYLSPLQVEGTVASAIFSTFKNSNFGYTRKTAQAVANIKRKMRKGYKEETIAFMTKQMVRDGLSEENAKRFAEKVYNKSKYRDVANVAMFGFGLNLLWEAGGYAIYLLLGDDDEEKEKMMKEIALRGSLGLLNGVPFGETMISAAMAVKEGDTKYFRLPELIAVGDIENLAQVLNYDPVRGANDIVNMLTSMGVGVTPQVLTDILVAFGDVEELSAEELGMFAARFVNAPQSNLDRLMVDDAMENSAINAEEIMLRYAEYKKSKNAPITQFLYSDEEEQKAVERYGKRFAKLLDERLENVVEDTGTFDLFYNDTDAEMKKVLASMRKKHLAGDEADKFQKVSTKTILTNLLEGKDIENVGYYKLTNADDVDEGFVVEMQIKELKDISDEFKKLKDAGDKDAARGYKNKHSKELKLYKKLDKYQNDINEYKSKMKKKPENAERYMAKIREKRAKAIELINNYRNNE